MWFLPLAVAVAAPADDCVTWAEALPASALPPPADGYRLVGPALAAACRAAREKPGAVAVEEIGRSAGGRPLWAFHVADPSVPVEREVLVVAGIHALEWISSESAFLLLDELLALPPRGVSVTVVPVFNPDGRLATELDRAAGERRYRRGNGASPPVDLNRDFEWHRDGGGIWARLLPGYHATSPAPLSQPESRALDALAARHDYDRAASLHAFGGYLYYPWAGRWEHADDEAELLALGREMEQAQGRHAYRPRQLSRWGFFFRAHGAELDHLYGRYGTKAFLIEITRSGFDVRHPRASLRDGFRWYNPPRPGPHAERTVAALRALIRVPDPL